MQIFLVATSLKFQNFQLDLYNKHEVPLFIRRNVWFSFKKTGKKNFCLIISLFREFLCSFFIGKSETLFREVLTNISKNSFLKLSIFFLAKLSFQRVYKIARENRFFSFWWRKRFAFWPTAKSLNRHNCQNGLRFWVQLRYFLLNEYIYFNMVLTNKCCKTGTWTCITGKLICQDRLFLPQYLYWEDGRKHFKC